MRRVYLKMETVESALRSLLDSLASASLPAQQVGAAEAAGRVTAGMVRARRSHPTYHAAAMDGYAVRSTQTAGASQNRPVRLRLNADAVSVDTGDVLPASFDSVVKIEDVYVVEGDTLEVPVATSRWQHVRLVGEDVVQDEVVVGSGQWITPFHVAVLLAAGHVTVSVRRRPSVALIPTGDELAEPGADLVPGQVPEFNSKMLAAMVRQWGGEPVPFEPQPDDPRVLEKAVRDALKRCDVVVVGAGSSAGRQDYTPQVFEQVGRLLTHGVNLMPGKPTALAVADGKALLGLPGYPVSAAVAADAFLRPVLAHLLGTAAAEREQMQAVLARKLPSKAGHREVVRVQAARVGDRAVAIPLPRGAGVISSMSRATALVTVDERIEGFGDGETVGVELLVGRSQVDRTVLHVGSHDLCMDLLDNTLRTMFPGWSLASNNVGSMGGLLALRDGYAHVAGCHLLDADSGTYNVRHIREHLEKASVRCALFRLAVRQQGLLVPAGNPKGLRSVEDLGREGLVMVNRQVGSGTRVLMDHLVQKAGLDPVRIQGYERVESTHMAVAEAVRSGSADTGPGIRAAACALGLDFIALADEYYELAVPLSFMDDPAVARLLQALRHPDFIGQVDGMEGYRAEDTGKQVYASPEP